MGAMVGKQKKNKKRRKGRQGETVPSTGEPAAILLRGRVWVVP